MSHRKIRRALKKQASQRLSLSRFVCEQVEGRVLLSGATFGTPVTIPFTGAEAPLVAERYDGSSNPYGLAVATPTAVEILTGAGNGTGQFTVSSSIPLPAHAAVENPFDAGDFSGNGNDDIVLDSYNTTTGDGSLTYETNNGSGVFTAGTVTPVTDGGAGFMPISGRAADLNGDGDTDLALVGKPGTGNQLVLAVMISSGAGGFTETDYPIQGSNAAGNTSNEEIFLNVSDEIVVYDGSSGNLDVFSGPGTGTFTQLTPVPLTANLLVGGTFNNNEDLVAANGDQVTVLVNQGNGVFQADPQGPITLPGLINSMAIGDFNLDGNNDIITNQGILFGNGDETFNTTPQALPVSISSSNFSNTMEAVFMGSSKQGFVGFSSSGNALISVANTTLAATTVNLSSSNNPAAPGSDVQFTADVSAPDTNITATPTGSVTFYNGTTSLGTVALTSGSATLDAGSSLKGSDSITAQYSGDTDFAASTSTALTQTSTATSAVTLTSNENPALAGDDVQFTATVSGNDGANDTPSGTVEFFDNGQMLGSESLDGNGAAVYDTTGALAVGTHPITAQYQGDNNYAASQSTTLSQVVNEPSLVPLVVSATIPTAIVAGSKVHGTALISLDNKTSSTLDVSSVSVLVSTNSDIAKATLIASKSLGHLAIPAGIGKGARIAISGLPATLANGSYQLLAEATTTTSEVSNSTSGPAVTIAAPFISLAAAPGTGTVAPVSVKPGKPITVTITLTNNGNIASTLASLNVGLSTDGQTEAIAIETPTVHLPIKPGKGGVLRLHFKVPATTAAGTYKPYVVITDDRNVVTVIGQAFTVVG